MAKKTNPIRRSLSQQRLSRVDAILGEVSDYLVSLMNEAGGPYSRMEATEKVSERKAILRELEKDLAAPDRVIAVRSKLAQCVGTFTLFGVVLMVPGKSPFAGITGELRPRMMELTRRSPDLMRAIEGIPEVELTTGELAGNLFQAQAWAQLRAQAFDRARMVLGDGFADPKRDWYHPFIISYAIAWEFKLRCDLGMPPNLAPHKLDGLKVPGTGRANGHAHWPYILEGGSTDPRADWDSLWEAAFDEPSPYKDFDPDARGARSLH